jgi:hypothetical protein
MDPKLFFMSIKAIGFIKKLIFPLAIILIIIGFFYMKNTGAFDEIKKTFDAYSEKISEHLEDIKELIKF